MLSRRSILAGLISAPIIVRASSLMKLAPTMIIKPAIAPAPPVCAELWRDFEGGVLYSRKFPGPWIAIGKVTNFEVHHGLG